MYPENSISTFKKKKSDSDSDSLLCNVLADT